MAEPVATVVIREKDVPSQKDLGLGNRVSLQLLISCSCTIALESVRVVSGSECCSMRTGI